MTLVLDTSLLVWGLRLPAFQVCLCHLLAVELKSCQTKFLTPEISLCSNVVLVRWGMTVQERVTEELGEEHEMR